MTGSEFTLRRMLLLGKKDFVESRVAVLSTTAAVVGLNLIAGVIGTAFGQTDSGSPAGSYAFILVLAGLIVASLSFNDLSKKGKNISWIMTPASQAEKYVTEFVISTIGVILYVTVAYFLLTALTRGLTLLLFHRGTPLFNPFTREAWYAILAYIELHAFFFFGAVYFRNRHFIKTVLWMTIIAIGLSIFAGIVFRIVFADYFTGFGFQPRPEMAYLFHMGGGDLCSSAVFNRFFRVLEIVGKVLLYVVPPFFWVTGYFRLTETEVRNGV